jgi:ferric-dicitrate binding protein FerR (iron transport regulator)
MSSSPDCRRFEELQARALVLEARLDDAERAFLRSHACVCADCGAEAALLAALDEAGQREEGPGLSDVEVARKVEALLERAAAPARPARRPWRAARVGLAVAAAAAAVLVAAAVVVLAGGRARPGVHHRVVAGPVVTGLSPVATVTGASGRVFIEGRSFSGTRGLGADQRLLVTRGQAEVAFADGSTVALDPDTELDLARPAGPGVSVRLHTGRVRCQVAPRHEDAPFQVQTDWGTVQVIGTVFSVRAAPQVLEVSVARGRVKVFPKEGEPVLVEAGTAFTLAGGTRPLSPEARRALLGTPEQAVAPAPSRTDPPGVAPVPPPVAGRQPAVTSVRPAPVPPPEAATLDVPDVSALMADAATRRARGDFRTAVETYERLIRIHPASPEARTCRVLKGQILLRNLGQAGQALAEFDRYLSTGWSGALADEAARGRIQALRALGRPAAEAEACRALLRNLPQSIYARQTRTRLEALTAGRTP